MKLACVQKELKRSLSIVSRAVPSRPTHPILGNILLTADQKTGQISLTGFDLSMGIQSSFTAEVIEEGAIAIPAKLFNDLISRINDGEIEIETSTKNIEDDNEEEVTYEVELTHKTGKCKISGMNAAEFPLLPKESSTTTLEVPVDILANGLRSVLFASSTDETKQILTGVHVSITSDKIEFATTDGRRLAIASSEFPADHQYALTISAKNIKELEGIIRLIGSDKKLTMRLSIEPGEAIFQAENILFTSRLLEGQYPAYHNLLPAHFKRSVQCDRKDLLSGIERVSILSDKNIVKLTLDNENQLIELRSEAEMGFGTETLTAKISDEGGGIIGFNAKYLSDALKNISSTDVLLEMNEETAPVIISPLNGDKITHLVMPVSVRS